MPVPVATNRASMASALTTMLNTMETQSQRAARGNLLYELHRGMGNRDRRLVSATLQRFGFNRADAEAMAPTITALAG